MVIRAHQRRIAPSISTAGVSSTCLTPVAFLLIPYTGCSTNDS